MSFCKARLTRDLSQHLRPKVYINQNFWGIRRRLNFVSQHLQVSRTIVNAAFTEFQRFRFKLPPQNSVVITTRSFLTAAEITLQSSLNFPISQTNGQLNSTTSSMFFCNSSVFSQLVAITQCENQTAYRQSECRSLHLR